jgi:hypothetical protein
MKFGTKHKITNYDDRPYGDGDYHEEMSNEK